MEAHLLATWGPILEAIVADEAILAQVLAENEWFVAPVVRHAVACMRPWWQADALAGLRARHPAVRAPKRIGLILAGNLPLVGLHDVLMVLLSGHLAVVKPSHKDRVLLRELLRRSPREVQLRVRLVEAIAPGEIDFLLATGSNATARQLADAFAGVPKLMRQNRFSVGVLDGQETPVQLAGLAADILTYHGMGCRSVSSILVPPQYDWDGLIRALETFDEGMLAPVWSHVLRYERAIAKVLGGDEPRCAAISIEHSAALKPPKIGVLNVVECATPEERDALLASVQADLQCIVGAGGVPFGQAQMPALDDFADGVDTLALLTSL